MRGRPGDDGEKYVRLTLIQLRTAEWVAFCDRTRRNGWRRRGDRFGAGIIAKRLYRAGFERPPGVPEQGLFEALQPLPMRV